MAAPNPEEDAAKAFAGANESPPSAEDVVRQFPFRKLLSYADKLDWFLMVMGTLGSIVHGMAQPVGYLLLGKALDAFGSNIGNQKEMVHALMKVIPFVWYMAIATLPAGILEISCWMYSSQRQLTRLRLGFLKSLLSQDIGAFDTNLTTGKIISGMTNNMDVIQDAIGEKLGHFISSFATFFVGIIIAFICCWDVALFVLLVVPLILAIGATYTNKMNTISSVRMKHLSDATSLVEQVLSQIKTVYSFVGESSAAKSFANYMANIFNISKKEAAIKGLGLGMFQTATFCSWALIVWVGAISVTDGRSQGGETIAAVMCILFGAISITYAAPDFQTFNQAKAAGNEVFDVIERKPCISYDNKGDKPEKFTGKIDIREVHFAYPSRQDKLILRGFSLSIEAGKVVALVGSSGCGKSTIISLIERFYDPFSGEIFIDGHNIKDLDLKYLRSNIGAVSQEPALFSGTIKDNMMVGRSNASDEDIIKAATTADAHSFISQLPQQYMTEVGARGVQLSGGQKQRIAIARAILKNPPILLLDEATSALDTESEKLVQEALERAMVGRTVILIAHRISTVVNADVIVVVENGRVAQTGTHRELLENSKFYSNLVSMTSHKESGTREKDLMDQVPSSRRSSSAQASDLYESFSIEPRDVSVGSMQETQKPQVQAVPFFRIWFRLEKLDYAKIAFGSFGAALSGITKPLFGFYIMTIGVAYYGEDARNKVGRYSILFSAVGFLLLVTHIVQHYLYGVVGEKSMKNTREALFSAVLQNEIAWFEKPENGVGFVASCILSKTSMVKTIISDKMAIIVQCISSILIATIVSIVVNWRMALVAWAVMPCHFIGGLIQAKSAQGFAGNSALTHQSLVALASEATSNIRTVASFTYEDEILEKAKKSLRLSLKVGRKESIKYGIIQGISLCLWNIAHAVALWYTTILVKRNQASFEDGIRSYQIFSLTVPSITELWTLIPTVISAITILTPAFQILDRKTEILPDSPDASDQQRIQGKIDIKGVTFAYPTRPEVVILDNFSLKIDAGLKVALVGPSGAGKSSVVALLLRFYDPHKGRILIDNKNIKDYNLRQLRRQIGLVEQEPPLFSCSIRDNICYGNEGASETEITQAAMEANIHDFISSLPDGYETVVGEKGCQLSGGQKQRVAIARTILKRPTILLLDEATSALDGESERVVMKSLYSGATTVIVAHRLSTVIESDVIVVMDNGKVSEKGQHSTLVASGGLYSKLYQLQNQSKNHSEE